MRCPKAPWATPAATRRRFRTGSGGKSGDYQCGAAADGKGRGAAKGGTLPGADRLIQFAGI
jgi:hypothetical protein